MNPNAIAPAASGGVPMHKARKRFGQHFLRDTGVIARIIAAVNPHRGERLVEIGPGLGALTLPLLSAAGALDAIELDRDLIATLARRAQHTGTLRLHQGDALKFDFSGLAGDGRLRIVGNLPYNISTPLLFHLLAHRQAITDIHVMLQREVVERMAALPGSAAYGRLSIMLQYRYTVTPLFSIRAEAFDPAPKVESAFVRLQPHALPPVAVNDEARFSALVRQAFSQRRKTLRNALQGMASVAQLQAAGIDPGVRAEQVSVKQYATLANCLAEDREDHTTMR